MSTALVPAAVLVTVGTTELARIAKKQNPTMKPLLGGFIVGIGLYALLGLDERLGRLFAVLVIVSVILEHGPVLFPLIGGLTK